MSIRKYAATAALAATMTAAIGLYVAVPDGIFANGFDGTPSDYCGQLRVATATIVNAGSWSADMAKYENLLGKTGPRDPAQPFPAQSVSPYLPSMPKAGFIAAKFTVPAGIDVNTYGEIMIGETFIAGYRTLTVAIAQTCGFSIPNPQPHCTVSGASQGRGIAWKIQGGSVSGIRCVLTPGQSYFLNVKFDPEPAGSDRNYCGATSCSLPFVTSVQR